MNKILYSYIPYIDEDVFYNLLKKTDNLEYSKSGSNSKCAIIDNFAVLKTGNIPSHDNSFPKMINCLHNLKKENVNVVQILGYAVTRLGDTFDDGARYDKGYIVQEKAKGSELLCPSEFMGKSEQECYDIVIRYLKTLDNIPQQHFDKWVADYKIITDNMVLIDPSKESNFFYDDKNGFSFIDLNFFSKQRLFDKTNSDGTLHHDLFIDYTFLPFRALAFGRYDKYFKTSKDVEFAQKVMRGGYDKMVNALLKIGVTLEDIEYCLEKGGMRNSRMSSFKTEHNVKKDFTDDLTI